jgi:MFS family permease
VFLAKYFFSNVGPAVGFIFTLLAFAEGFAVCPFGALLFGRTGDLVGRKYTFLITMTLMGLSTLDRRRAPPTRRPALSRRSF